MAMKRTVTVDVAPARSIRVRPNNRISKASYSRIPRGIKSGRSMNTVHRFKRLGVAQVATNEVGFIIGATNANRFSMQFEQASASFFITAISSVALVIPNYAEFAALFDQIMIESVSVKFTHTADAAVASNGLGAAMLYTAIDFNDANVPTSDADILQYASVRSKSLTVESGPIIRYVKPMFPQIVFSGIAGVSYRASRGFLQKDITVPHYGLKGFLKVPNYNAGAAGVMNIEVTYNYACKNVI